MVLPDNSILITANVQSETGFPSSHQLKSYVASKSRLKLAARAVLSADAGLLVMIDPWRIDLGLHLIRRRMGRWLQIELCLLIEEYEKKLKAAGVHCELHLAKGAVHAFCTLPG